MTATILSLILPKDSRWRYLRKGRRAVGFVDGALVFRTPAGTNTGVSSLVSTEVTMAAGNNAVVSKRLTVFSGRAIATAATIPAASGSLRELIIQNANTAVGDVTVTSPSTNIYSAASATPSATNVIAAGTTARFLSNGASWFRVT